MVVYSKVKLGVDFLFYICEIKFMGVIYYEVYVMDGYMDYYVGSDFMVIILVKYEFVEVVELLDIEVFCCELMVY